MDRKTLRAMAYSPSHITGFFVIFKKGSTGAGVNVKEGVVTEVVAKPSKKSKIIIKINGKKVKAKTSERVIRKILARLKNKKYFILVKHKTKIPIGYGLGISGAGALSLSLAINKALSVGLTKKECVDIAKEAEIEEGTGLGDVIAEQYYGIMIGKKPYPSKEVEIIPTNKKYVVLGFFKPIKTKSVIRNPAMKQKINKVGIKCMKILEKEKTLEKFIELCDFFSRESGLLTRRLKKIKEKIPYANMSMLGETLFVITNEPMKEANKMRRYTKRILISEISKEGAKTI
ncbi:MAG: hypothetical protein N3D73_00610 [Candidatus Diapherotrites archaeon]|nr:hypothetical protein [Candidatus Diapherotrites archaeon]